MTDRASSDEWTDLFKGHAVEDHARAGGDVLHRVHVDAHPKPVQQLRPQLPLLNDMA